MKGNWKIITSEEYLIVFPDGDNQPHGERITDTKYDINTAICACNPKVEMFTHSKLADDAEFYGQLEKPVVTHNAFDGRQ